MRPDALFPPEPRPGRRSYRHGRRAAILVALVLLAALVALWIDLKPIAEGYIARTFAAAGVPARYTLAELGPDRQRLTNVVIGDPATPDLVADWIETETRIGIGGARLTGIQAGHVRLRGTLVGARVSLGAIDRLLPASSGKPFALPAIDVAIADGRLRLVTPMGLIGAKVTGGGRLDDGFRGTIAAVSDKLVVGGCAGRQVAVTLRIATRSGKPVLTGPTRAGRLACGGAGAEKIAADLDATLAPDLRRWTGRVTLTTQALAAGGYAAQAARGDVSFDGVTAQTQGRIALSLTAATGAGSGARSVAVAGAYRVGGVSAFDGSVSVANAVFSARRRASAERSTLQTRLAAAMSAAKGSPIAPLVNASANALTALARDVSGVAKVALAWSHGQGELRVESGHLASASGVGAMASGGAGVRIAWPRRAVTIDTDLTIAGGGLPGTRVSLRQTGVAAPVRGVATFDAYAAGGAALALTPVAFALGRDGMQIDTIATVSGPVGAGRVDGLTLPIHAAWDGETRLMVGDRCTLVRFDRLALAEVVLGATRLGLCPRDGAIVRSVNGRIGGGATLSAVRIAGTLGGSPLAFAADRALLRIADAGFAIDGGHVVFGPSDHQTRLDVSSLSGTMSDGEIAGNFGGGAGQIANVPLSIANAAGDWRFAGGALSLTGTLGIADADNGARFKPLSVRGLRLSLARGRIDAAGALYEPTRGVKVANVTIHHDLSAGAGTADLIVPSLGFTDTFQPDRLTPLTYGVVAEVKGAISGSGHIAWSTSGVTSSGRFRTDALDLAAAFGPVTGLAGEIMFTDLLLLQSAPGQVATVRTINPGIAVNDGRIVYQTLPGARIRVNSARWPFAAGTLTLDPTLLDFGVSAERRLTFRVGGAAADQFLQQFDFKNLNATGVFDGVLPMIFDAVGGRIEQGQLTVRGGGGSIAYVGDLSQKDLGFWGNLAFQALKSLRYQRLSITMNGPLSGEMVTAVRFAGVSQGQGAKSNFLVRRLQRLPFVFNVTIRAPFRGLLDSAASFYDPRRLIERNLPALLQEQEKQAAPPPTPIQPPASRTMP